MIEDGQQTSRSASELVLIQLRSIALEVKNPNAGALMHKLFEKHEPRKLHPDAGVLVVPAPMSTEECIAQTKRQSALMDQHGFRSLALVAEFERQQRKKKQSKEPVS